eukprot:3009793-Amphidinium_carterae.1
MGHMPQRCVLGRRRLEWRRKGAKARQRLRRACSCCRRQDVMDKPKCAMTLTTKQTSNSISGGCEKGC